MEPRTIVEPLVEPIPLDQAKTQLRVDHDEEDAEIGRKITAAREELEKLHGRAYITRTLEIRLDEFPSAKSGLVLLPRPPTSEIVSIIYLDVDENEQTLDAADYEFDSFSEPARLRPSASAGSWPATAPLFSAVRIQWKAGFGMSPSDVPAAFREAIKLALGDFYEQRETIVLGLNVNTTNAIGQLLGSDRIYEGNLIP